MSLPDMGRDIFFLFPLSAALAAGGAVAAAAALASELPSDVADQVDHCPQDEQGYGGVDDILHNVLLSAHDEAADLIDQEGT